EHSGTSPFAAEMLAFGANPSCEYTHRVSQSICLNVFSVESSSRFCENSQNLPRYHVASRWLNWSTRMRLFPLPEVVEALLPQLSVDATNITRVEPMAGGLSGGRVYRLWLRNPDGGQERTRVLKYAEPLEGWLGAVSGDTLIREAQLAASGLLADLPRDIATSTLAVAFRGPRDQPEGAAL